MKEFLLTNKVILILYLIPLFVQTSIPPYNMKVSFELIDEKKAMLSEIKRFSRETISKNILEKREQENPNGC